MESFELSLTSIVLTAILSSVLSGLFTSLAFYFYFKYLERTKLNSVLDEYLELVKARLKEGFEESGRELLPEFKEEVRQGFKAGLADVLGGELIDQTARTIAKSSADIVESGFNLLKGAWTPDQKQTKGSNKNESKT